MGKGRYKVKKQLTGAKYSVNTDYEKILHIFSSQCIAILGYNPNNDYTIDEDLFVSDIATPDKDIRRIQKKLIVMDTEKANELVLAKKYIYSMLFFPGDKKSESCLILKLIGKTNDGYIPFYLYITYNGESHGKEKFNLNASLSAVLKGKDYFVLRRYDEFPTGPHENILLDILGNEAKITEKENKINQAGLPHMHEYNRNVLLRLLYASINNPSEKVNVQYTTNNRRLDAVTAPRFEEATETIKYLYEKYNVSDIELDKIGIDTQNLTAIEIFDKANDFENRQNEDFVDLQQYNFPLCE